MSPLISTAFGGEPSDIISLDNDPDMTGADDLPVAVRRTPMRCNSPCSR
jgi:hypothetical protein